MYTIYLVISLPNIPYGYIQIYTMKVYTVYI